MLFVARVRPFDALVLRAMPWRDKDRFLVLLTEERGKVFALAQGAMRPQNRLAPASQTGVWGRFWLAKGRELDRVTDARIFRFPHRLRSEAIALAAFGVITEALDAASPPETKDPPLYREALDLFERLEGGLSTHKWLVIAQVRLLAHFGWLPRLTKCAVCDAPVKGKRVPFSLSEGGSLCAPCAALKDPPDGQEVQGATLQALESLIHQPRLITALHLSPPLWMEALELGRACWHYHLETELSSWRVWEQIRRRDIELSHVTIGDAFMP